MATTLILRAAPDWSPTFPDRCVGCGGAASTTSNLAITRLVEGRRGTQRPLTIRCAVPHCNACARATKSVFLAQLLPFGLGFLVAGGAALVGALHGAFALGIDEVGVTNPRTPNSLVVAGAAGLAGGIAGGFVVELVARALLLPVFGLALWRAPLLVPSLFTDSDHVAGLTAKTNADMTLLTVTFHREEVAREFAALNAGSVHGWVRGST